MPKYVSIGGNWVGAPTNPIIIEKKEEVKIEPVIEKKVEEAPKPATIKSSKVVKKKKK